MISDWREQAFRAALKMIENGPPKNLVTRAQPEAADRGTSLSASDLTDTLKTAEQDNGLLNALGMQVHKWDAAGAHDEWTGGTKPSSQERRKLITDRLGLDQAGADALLAKRPIFHDETVVITAPWNRWYTHERAAQHEFYWPRYRDYLLSVRGWEADNVTSLDLATTDVVERLTDPTRKEAHQSKGIVVGYVQSGKTANFTGVIAKAIDAGYRLIIVMTGTVEMLRSQTQRRIDMEMVGRQNIIGDIPEEQASQHKIDYFDDDDWRAGRFLDLGQDMMATEIHRLTQHKTDYRKLGHQFKSLKLERAFSALPLYDPANLFKAHARLAVVKKNATVLKKLVGDIKANKNAFAEIPVLIIDDESDEASVNTVDPEKVKTAKAEGKEFQERKAINACISDMLDLMPRAQYVGYTATPFANVFVDPSDPLSIFPKDFVIGLRRPPGYMGVDDFHDLDETEDGERSTPGPNRLAHVRDLKSQEDDVPGQDTELRTAIDMFVLTGAAKLYRADVDPSLMTRFKHHTMLVHHSVKMDDHKALAERVRKLWQSSEFSKPSGRLRLQRLYDSDLFPVSINRCESDVPPLPAFDELADYVPQAIAKITEHRMNPVIVVNSDKEIEQQILDFDRHSTWRILVGGAKLSRGFTVEGLTVTYFRRATNMNASLTQMGRWFGFRHGYRDLVRLYIARNARFGRKQMDLYEAFEGVCRDERAFRGQLEQYAVWDGDMPRVLPSQIPPLVTQHLPWLLPTAKNKMFNAVVAEQGDQPFTPAGFANHVDLLKENLETWRPILAEAQATVELPQVILDGNYEARVGLAPADHALEVMERTHYLSLYGERVVEPALTFYRRLIHEGLLKDFLVVVPQPDRPSVDIRDVGPRRTVGRDRRAGRGGKFGEITEPKHRRAVEMFVDKGRPSPPSLENWVSEERGALLVYLVEESKPEYETVPKPELDGNDPEYGLVVAFSAYVPSVALKTHPNLIRFRVRNTDDPESPIVDAANPGGR